MKFQLQQIKKDFSASIVVFLVALPLCLGIAQASNPASAPNVIPLFSGIIAGIVGGIIVGLFSGSQLSVSGPAAGLTTTVSAAIISIGNHANVFEIFLLGVFLSGVLQIIFGFIKAGDIGAYVPNSVIKGMLAAIGLLLILKQIPHFLGEDTDPEGDENFIQPNKKNTFTAIYYAIKNLTPSVCIIGIICLSIIFILDSKRAKKIKFLNAFPAALVVVIVGTIINEVYKLKFPTEALINAHLVNLPSNKAALLSSFKHPDFSFITNSQVWIIAFTIAIVASLETLLGIEAVDKLDPIKRLTPANQELKAQGIGNMFSGLLGGLPVTSVIVRSSANVNSGAQTKLSSIFHGILLAILVFFCSSILNKIPLAALAAILIATGYKLINYTIVKDFYKKGLDQFIPFMVTILAILATDLLKGIGIGILVALFFLVRSNFRSCVFMINDENNYLIRLRKDVSFLNKPIIKKQLDKIPRNSFVIIDATRADFIDKDVIEEVNSFIANAPNKSIKVEIKKSLNKPMHLLFINAEN